MSVANNGQIKMAAQMYSDISAYLITFSSVDRYAGDNSATSFGHERYEQARYVMTTLDYV